MDNKFIVIEGLDGSGKTTVISKIIEYLNTKYNIHNIYTVHEPGGTPVSDCLRVLIKYSVMNEPINSISELLMIYAARLQLIEQVIQPVLSLGYWVIGDRYDLSSQAYQGSRNNMDELLLDMLSKKIMSILSPSLILYLDVKPEIGISRVKSRKMHTDRFEQESLLFFKKVRARYQNLAISQKNIVIIDANQNIIKVTNSIYKSIDKWLLE